MTPLGTTTQDRGQPLVLVNGSETNGSSVLCQD